jgi:methionyl aminopeptidase
MIILKSKDEIVVMRRAGRVVGDVLAFLKEAVRPGLTTGQLDSMVENRIREAGAIPAFKGYNGFPASLCASLNEQVVHGIPGSRILREGDIISLDVGAILDGFYGDAAETLGVGEISPEAAKLLQVTQESLFRGIEQARVDQYLGDIGHAVQKWVEANGFSVVRDYVGHGIGRAMHESPPIPNYGEPGRGPRLKAGMVLAIEPMVNVGGYSVREKPDHWTVVTADGSLSAHFEHTVAVTQEGPEILTRL